MTFSSKKKPPKGLRIKVTPEGIRISGSKFDPNLLFVISVLAGMFLVITLGFIANAGVIPEKAMTVSMLLILTGTITSISRVKLKIDKDTLTIKNGIIGRKKSILIADIKKARVISLSGNRLKFMPLQAGTPNFGGSKASGSVKILEIIGKNKTINCGSDYKDSYKRYFKDIINEELTKRNT